METLIVAFAQFSRIIAKLSFLEWARGSRLNVRSVLRFS